jgi:hypothetical protein
MTATIQTELARTDLRRQLLFAAYATTVFGILHHIDHIVRGTHSGWPFKSDVTPFTYSLLIYLLLLPGIYLTLRGRVGAGYWLIVSLLTLGLVVPTHLGPQAIEPVASIYTAYSSPVVGVLAVVILVGLLLSLVTMLATAVRARVVSQHW